MKKYKPSYTMAFLDLSTHLVYSSCSYYLVWYFRNSYMSIFTTLLHGLLLVKTFIIFHDCGHNSYTANHTLNTMLGAILGPFVYFPFSWNYMHNTHHLTNGRKDNIYEYAHNEVIFNTLSQYQKLSPVLRIITKFFFSPSILFTFLTYIQFAIVHRVYPIFFLFQESFIKPSFTFLVIEQVFNNIAIASLLYFQYKYSILYHCLVSSCITSTVGALLFFNQHTYNPPYIVDNKDWKNIDSGLKGSSFIQIPWFLKYFTGGIEYHHIHHYNSKIPNYNLRNFHEEVLSTSKILDNIVTLSLKDCYNNLSLSVYDEDNNRFISFSEADATINVHNKNN